MLMVLAPSAPFTTSEPCKNHEPLMRMQEQDADSLSFALHLRDWKEHPDRIDVTPKPRPGNAK